MIQSPNGRGIWRIWRWFSRTDVRRFRAHYRILWPGWVNGVMLEAAPPGNIVGGLNARFQMTMDHLEIVTPMEPADPNPATQVNEAVMIMDENGQMHLLGEPGFEQMPDTAGNPNGFTIATTAASSLDLPPAEQRIFETPMTVPPGMVELNPGVIVQWLVNENGQVVAENDGLPGPDPILSDGILGGQKHQALLEQPTGIDGFELDMDEGNTPLQMHGWMLDQNGEVVGASPGQIVIGPPRDTDGIPGIDPQTAFGGPIPMNPTVRDEFDQVFPGMAPVDFGIIEEDAPTAAEVAQLNARLQAAGIPPVQPPFQLCIRSVRARHIWGIDRRFVMDCWRHHWTWFIAQHITLTGGTYRVWLTRTALSFFNYSGHHFVAGLPPQWRMLTIADLRFFRVCYRVYCPNPGVARVKIEQLYAVLPVDPGNPNSDLMMLTTQSNENALNQEVPPAVRAGLQPDPLPVGPDGVFVENLDPVLDTLDMGGGGTGIFDGDLSVIPPDNTMTEVTMVGNRDFAQAMRNNQLQLYSWPLAPDGTVKRTTFVVECSQGQGCQLPDEQGHGASNIVAAASTPSLGFVTADNFRAASDHPIRHACWWGTYYNFQGGTSCAAPPTDAFTITYYNDAGGFPGSIRASFPVPATRSLTARVIDPGGLNLPVYSYGADHPPVNALPGECLWISVQNNVSPSCAWVWNTAAPGDGYAVSNLTQQRDYDLSWCLDVPTAAGSCGGPPLPRPLKGGFGEDVKSEFELAYQRPIRGPGPMIETITFTEDPAPVLPAFEDDMGNPMPNPTMTSFVMSTEPAVPTCCAGNADKVAPGQVNFADITSVLANFGAAGNPNGSSVGDSDCNGAINFADITTTLANFLANCP